jgi:formate hydrogenlyase subunit 6/NADH:ubiquinone oxidoreductase subunit I
MSAWRLTRGDLVEWLNGLLREGRRIVAPVEDGRLRRFQAVDSAARICLSPGKTRWSPKEFLFPRTERLFAYSTDGGELRLAEPAPPETPQILLGVRPCDAAGLCRLDAVFLGGEADPFYARRRAFTTVVSLACDEAGPECFCTAVGGSPAGEEGSDLQLAQDGEGWLLRPLTQKGEALVASLRDRLPGRDPAAWDDVEARARRVAERIRQRPLAREWAAVLESSFGLPLWEALGRRCLGCSICTYVCPSCSCFDVQDTGNAWCGERCRSWDSCTFALFTRHASGHDPRPSQAARYRQRVLHKFAYFPALHEGQWMCVGCGRCVALCPVGMNVKESVERVATAPREGADAGG